MGLLGERLELGQDHARTGAGLARVIAVPAATPGSELNQPGPDRCRRGLDGDRPRLAAGSVGDHLVPGQGGSRSSGLSPSCGMASRRIGKSGLPGLRWPPSQQNFAHGHPRSRWNVRPQTRRNRASAQVGHRSALDGDGLGGLCLVLVVLVVRAPEGHLLDQLDLGREEGPLRSRRGGCAEWPRRTAARRTGWRSA